MKGYSVAEMNNCTVSVIIPVYNVFPYVRESIDSVIHQTYSRLEIIIIDDGSTDGSGEICDELAGTDDRIKVLHTENRGLSAARNIGLNIMTGDVVAFLDSDDAFVPDAIEKALQALVEEKAEIVAFGFVSLRTKGLLGEADRNKQEVYSCVPPPGRYNSDESLRLMLLDGKICIAVWSMIFRISLWKGISFPEGDVYEDNYVIPEIMKRAGSVALLPEILVLNRRRKGSITQTFTEKNMRDQLRAHHYLTEFVRQNPETFDNTAVIKALQNEIGIRAKQFSIIRDSSYRAELRQSILPIAKGIKHKDTTNRTKIIIFGIKYAPWLFSRLLYLFVLRKDIET